jgi:hypothetical protein
VVVVVVRPHPWDHLKSGDSFGVRDERQTCTSRLDDLADLDVHLVGQVAQDAEYDQTREEGGHGVESGDNHGVPVDVVVEVVVGGVHGDGAEADVEGEEALSDGGVPHLKRTVIVVGSRERWVKPWRRGASPSLA